MTLTGRRSRAAARTFALALAVLTAALAATVLIGATAPRASAAAGPNPLGASATPPPGNPLVGVRWFIDEHWGLGARQARAWRTSHPGWAKLMRKIADQPEAHRVGGFTKDVGGTMRAYLARAGKEAPGTVPVVVAYRLKHIRCGGYGDSRAETAAYKRWIDAFASAIGDHRLVVFLEPDALITTPCLSTAGLRTRIAELRYAIAKLAALRNTVAYVDAGAADALSYQRTAHLLNLVGVQRIQGFFLNATHFDWTTNEVRYGNRVSRLVGGKHFVVSTAVNGRGPLRPRSRVKDGNEVLCNPAGRGLGVAPTTNTMSPLTDAYMWIGNPGRSGGDCGRGDPPSGTWWPAYALGLASRAAF